MKYTIKPAFQNIGKWVLGREEFDTDIDLTVCAKVFEEGSEYGIDGGKISKLEIRVGDEILVNFDRGWDVFPSEEVTPLYMSILAQFN